MALTSKCHMVIASCLLAIVFISLSGGTLIRKRHSLHLMVNTPDNPKFSLQNLARLSYRQVLGRLTGYPVRIKNPFSRPPKCNKKTEFRTIDGTCNNLRRPFMGAAKTPLMRLVENNTYEDGVDSPTTSLFYTQTTLPRARSVSLAVHQTTSNISNMHSHLMMNFGQFTDHDLTLSPEAGAEGGVEDGEKEECCRVKPYEWEKGLKECIPLDTTKDPVFTVDCVPLLRSSPTPGIPGAPVIRFQLNDLTSYIDGSQIYGSTNIRAKSLRSYKNGRLQTSEGFNKEERLPLARNNPSDCFTGVSECRFAAGDVRNSEHAALTSLHTLFVREHNRIAKEIQKNVRFTSDENVYQTTRKIVGAILQRITYNEFLPEVLGPELMRSFGLELLEYGRFTNYNARLDSSIVTEFSTAAFRFGHSLIRQKFTTSKTQSLDIREIFDAFITTDEFGSDGILQGMAKDNSEVRDRFITRGVRDDLLGSEMDLPAFNIQRGRDHGIASYNDIRRYFDLPTYNSFEDLVGTTHTQASVDSLKKVYPTVEDVEMFPGGLTEVSLKGALVGETFGRIIGTQFRRAKFGDRFWFETNDKTVAFTDRQLEEIRKASLADLYCQNVPGVSVRKRLLLADIKGNRKEDCSNIPTLDFSAWKK